MLGRRLAQRAAARASPASSRLTKLGNQSVYHHQTRSFLTNRVPSSYWMRRAKIAQIVWRVLVSYPQMHNINDPGSAINQIFARDTSERGRAFMFVLSQIPTDAPVDLYEFVEGASDAMALVYRALYRDGVDASVLGEIAYTNCVDVWNNKHEKLRELVGANADDEIKLTRIQVNHVGLSEINFSYSDVKRSEDGDDEDDDNKAKKEAAAKPEQHSVSANGDLEAPRDDLKQQEGDDDARPYSKFYMHESIQIKVKYDVREHVLVGSAPAVVNTTFEWTFESDVSRTELLDWTITSVTPFESKVATAEEQKQATEEMEDE